MRCFEDNARTEHTFSSWPTNCCGRRRSILGKLFICFECGLCLHTIPGVSTSRKLEFHDFIESDESVIEVPHNFTRFKLPPCVPTLWTGVRLGYTIWNSYIPLPPTTIIADRTVHRNAICLRCIGFADISESSTTSNALRVFLYIGDMPLTYQFGAICFVNRGY